MSSDKKTGRLLTKSEILENLKLTDNDKLDYPILSDYENPQTNWVPSSTFKTPNLHLNEWIKTDRPSMEDFNYDRAIIDKVFTEMVNKFNEFVEDDTNNDSRFVEGLRQLAQDLSNFREQLANTDKNKEDYHAQVMTQLHELEKRVELCEAETGNSNALNHSVTDINDKINDRKVKDITSTISGNTNTITVTKTDDVIRLDLPTSYITSTHVSDIVKGSLNKYLFSVSDDKKADKRFWTDDEITDKINSAITSLTEEKQIDTDPKLFSKDEINNLIDTKFTLATENDPGKVSLTDIKNIANKEISKHYPISYKVMIDTLKSKTSLYNDLMKSSIDSNVISAIHNYFNGNDRTAKLREWEDYVNNTDNKDTPTVLSPGFVTNAIDKVKEEIKKIKDDLSTKNTSIDTINTELTTVKETLTNLNNQINTTDENNQYIKAKQFKDTINRVDRDIASISNSAITMADDRRGLVSYNELKTLVENRSYRPPSATDTIAGVISKNDIKSLINNISSASTSDNLVNAIANELTELENAKTEGRDAVIPIKEKIIKLIKNELNTKVDSSELQYTMDLFR